MVRYNPDGYIPSSGRKIKEDGSVVNIADLIENLVNNGIEVTGSNVEYVGYSHEDKNTIAPDAKRGDSFIELDTKDVYFYDGTQWVVF